MTMTMTRIRFPVPIVSKAKLLRSRKVLKVHLKVYQAEFDIEEIATLDAPHAVSWHNKHDYHVRHHRQSGRYFQRLVRQPADVAHIDLSAVWDDNMFHFRWVLPWLADVVAEANGYDDTSYRGVERADDDWEALDELVPGDLPTRLLKRQLAIVRKRMRRYCLIGGALHELVPEPIAMIQKNEPVPVTGTGLYGWVFVFMAYSMADWERAVEVADRVGFPKLPGRMNIKLLELHREQFSPTNREVQKACLLSTFMVQFEGPYIDDRPGAARAPAELDEDDRQWLELFRACIDDAWEGVFDERLDRAYRALMSLDISPALRTFAEASYEVNVIRQVLAEDLGLPSSQNDSPVQPGNAELVVS